MCVCVSIKHMDFCCTRFCVHTSIGFVIVYVISGKWAIARYIFIKAESQSFLRSLCSLFSPSLSVSFTLWRYTLKTDEPKKRLGFTILLQAAHCCCCCRCHFFFVNIQITSNDHIFDLHLCFVYFLLLLHLCSMCSFVFLLSLNTKCVYECETSSLKVVRVRVNISMWFD